MNRTASVIALMIAATAAWAQSGTAAAPVKTSAQPAAKTTAPAKPAAAASANKQVTTPAKSPAASATSTKPAAAPAKAAAKPPASKKTSPAPAPQAEKKTDAPAAEAPAQPSASASSANKRDPFVSPIVTRVGGPTGCTGGKKCLVVDQVALKGVVRSTNGMIAVIVNAANKAYFMRENDPVYNGFVVKITADSITFRETTTDRLGKPLTRDIVKKVNAPVV